MRENWRRHFSFRDYDYLITVHCLGNFFEVDRLPSKRAKDVITVFDSISRVMKFRLLYSAILLSDAEISPVRLEIRQRVIRKAENAMKTAKAIMTKAADEGCWIIGSKPRSARLAQHAVRALCAVTVAATFCRRMCAVIPIAQQLLQT